MLCRLLIEVMLKALRKSIMSQIGFQSGKQTRWKSTMSTYTYKYAMLMR